MYSLSPSMDEFETVEKLEGECEFQFTGNLHECIDWTTRHHSCNEEKWSLDIIEEYNHWVAQEELGQGSEHL